MVTARTIIYVLIALALAQPALAQEVIDDEMEKSRTDLYQPPSIDPGDLETPEFAAPLAEPSLENTLTPTDSIPMPPPEQSYKNQVPKKGGKFRLQHPGAADGLLKIDKKGYQYKVPVKDKSQATSFRFAGITSPNITSSQGVTFADMYGGSGLYGLLGEYEWMPFQKFGMLGVQIGFGLVIARGNGRIDVGGVTRNANEIYTLFAVPLSALAVYRFEYFRRQWFVPYINGGATYFLLAEQRDDAKQPKFAGAPAAAFGGGIHIGISRLDLHSSFILSKEYGVADVWLTLDARVLAGLREDLNFSTQTISAGFTVDY